MNPTDRSTPSSNPNPFDISYASSQHRQHRYGSSDERLIHFDHMAFRLRSWTHWRQDRFQRRFTALSTYRATFETHCTPLTVRSLSPTLDSG
ncbi:hypothetical protein KFU94_14800 [Chloroflexi bacterium TSY]|nr:hypothetical protein [Chloroflexi bacterium TSY]